MPNDFYRRTSEEELSHVTTPPVEPRTGRGLKPERVNVKGDRTT
jgi:hypothetical protein